MSIDLSNPAPEIARDFWDRPLVVPYGGGNPKPYTRCTTYVGCIEDTYKLSQWQQRHLARGVALNDDVLQAIRDTDPDAKTELNELCDLAKDRSGAGDAARLGTYLHAVTEAADRGWDAGNVPLPILHATEWDSMGYVADLAAYLEATKDFTALAIEQFTVQDVLKVGGTPDRIVRFQGERYIADLKTGSIEYGALKIAAQLAMYARSTPYDPATHTRLEPHGASIQRGIVIHLPAGTGTCRLYWVDLLVGWEIVKLARQVREARKRRFASLFKELPVAQPSLADQIALSTTADAIRGLWFANVNDWTDALTELARQRIAALEEVPSTATA